MPRSATPAASPSSTRCCSARHLRPSCRICWPCRRTCSPITSGPWRTSVCSTRHRSEADRRRTYLSLVDGALDALHPVTVHDAARVVFVCTHNSARSQLAAALWNDSSPVPATSAGTHPAAAVHPGALAAAHRHHVPLIPVPPRHVDDVRTAEDVVITVCDAAHEELAVRGGGVAPDRAAGWLHWSIPDPARTGEDRAFDRVVHDLADRIARVAPAVRPIDPGAGHED